MIRRPYEVALEEGQICCVTINEIPETNVVGEISESMSQRHHHIQHPSKSRAIPLPGTSRSPFMKVMKLEDVTRGAPTYMLPGGSSMGSIPGLR